MAEATVQLKMIDVGRQGRGHGAIPGALGMHLATLALFIALAAFHTWPLAAAPGTWCRNDNADAVLNEWTIAWVAHRLASDPLRLFDANIFHPEKRTLAFSEHMLPQSLIAAPVLWAGGSPVLAFNVSLLAGFALTGWAFWFVVRRWTGSWTAGAVAGSLAAFNAHSLTRIAHLQAQHLEFLPLALLAFDRLLQTPRVRHALEMAAWFVLQALTSGYFLLFTAVTMICAAAARFSEWVGKRARAVVPVVLLSTVAAGLALAPFLVPYWRVRSEQGLVRTIAELRLYSAIPTDYLATGSLVHFKAWSQPFFRGDALFPGVIALLLVAVALALGVGFRDRRARMCLLITVVCVCLSFGVHFPPYRWLFEHVPLFQGLRAAIRFGHVALVGIAMLGGFGAARLLSLVTSSRGRATAAVALIVLVNAEAWRGPLGFTKYTGIPRIYKSLAAAPAGSVVACIPMYPRGEAFRNVAYMLGSTLNWVPMLNGYSGFVPASYVKHVEHAGRFPEPAAVDYLRRAGVTPFVVDTRRVRPERLALLKDAKDLRLWTTDGNISIYLLD